MTRILVAGLEPGAGATTVAVGLAHRCAYAGHAVRLERLAGDDRAAADAATFAATELATTSGEPLDPAALPAQDGVLIIEAPTGADAAALAAQLDAKLVAVGTETSTAPAGATPVQNHVPVASRATAPGVIRIPEDRLLAAPTVGRLLDASGALVLTRSMEGERAVCEYVVAAAISHDPADDYMRRFPRKAVVCRASRVDLALSAMMTGTELLLLTGGEEPSPYILDRAASSRATTLALAPGTTVQTLNDVQGSFGHDPFSHEAKVDRIGELMAAAIDDAAIEALLG